MSAHALIYPMFAMVVLSFTVLITLFFTRAKSVRDAKVSASHFQTYNESTEPDRSIRLSRHFINLFEAPVLFYVACLSAMMVGVTDTAVIALAWVYVALRLAHALIHTGPNILIWRIAAYFSSWFVLLALWGYVVVTVSMQG